MVNNFHSNRVFLPCERVCVTVIYIAKMLKRNESGGQVGIHNGLKRSAFWPQFFLRISAHVVQRGWAWVAEEHVVFSVHALGQSNGPERGAFESQFSLRVSAHVVQRGWAWHASPRRRRRNRVCFVGTCIRFVDTCIIAVSHSTDGPHIGGCVSVFFVCVGTMLHSGMTSAAEQSLCGQFSFVERCYSHINLQHWDCYAQTL